MSGWEARIRHARGRCLGRCANRATATYGMRFCDDCGAAVKRVKVALAEPTRPPGRQSISGAKSKPKCRLKGCDRTAQKPAGACYHHRGVASDVTTAPVKATCEIDGCVRPVKNGRRCLDHPLWRRRRNA